MNKKLKAIIVFAVISLAVGGISALITGTFSDTYESLLLPSFAPKGIVFPIVWSILYVLMGIGAGLVWTSFSSYRERGLLWFALQLSVNFLWSIIFFVENWFFLAFLWLILLLWLVIEMTYYFFKSNFLAGVIQIPYIVWLIFAGVLNFFVFMMN